MNGPNIHITAHCDIGESDYDFWPAYYDAETRTIHLNTVWFWATVITDGRVKHPERVFINRFAKAMAHETGHHCMKDEVEDECAQHLALGRVGL